MRYPPLSLVWSKTDRHTGKHNVYSNRVSLSLFLQRREGEEKKRKINELALVQANRCETIRVASLFRRFDIREHDIPYPLPSINFQFFPNRFQRRF